MLSLSDDNNIIFITIIKLFLFSKHQHRAALPNVCDSVRKQLSKAADAKGLSGVLPSEQGQSNWVRLLLFSGK